MTEKRTQTSTEYVSRPVWAATGKDSPEAFDLEAITLVRVVTTYPLTKAGSVQWGQSERLETELMTIPTHHLPEVLSALANDVGWVASGRARKENT